MNLRHAIYRRHALAAEPEGARPDGLVAQEHLELAALAPLLYRPRAGINLDVRHATDRYDA
jgi:hypothetical protein